MNTLLAWTKATRLFLAELLAKLGLFQSDKISDGRHLVVGFGVVTCLLLAVGISGWVVLSGQSRSFERLNAAGDLLALMDDARLSELTYTRDETSESIKATKDTISEVLKRANHLRRLVDDDRKDRLDKVINATEAYSDLFLSYVNLRESSDNSLKAMVDAANRASDSADRLQLVQEKYIQLDTDNVRKYRRQMENISENLASSYEIVIFVEQALDNEKDYLLSQDLRNLELARSQIAKLTSIINQLKGRIEDSRSLALLKKIDSKKDVYLASLAEMEDGSSPENKFNLNSPKVLNLDRAAFGMRDTAFALRSNERAVLSRIQQKVADIQELMARRLALSEEVNQILIGVGNARQSDRDFSLARTDEGRRIFSDRVSTLLQGVTNRAMKISQLLIEADEKEVFQEVLPSIKTYHQNFNQMVGVALQASTTGRQMVAVALGADNLLNAAQESRIDDINESKEWARVLAPIGALFGIGIILLALLMRQTQKKLAGAYSVISSSIDYASNIQRSLLPHDEDFSSAFAEHFVIWEPRDRVGGDIYWQCDWGEGELLVVADCTGHGVPGAFMSIIANSALEKALENIEPGDVGGLITRMHQGVQRTLRQDQSDGPSDDGLELGVCFLTPDRSQIIFSGGRFSLFVIDYEPEAEVIEIKGDREGIGYRHIPSDQIFASQIIKVREGSGFYMSSDGLIDQVGGERRRSFGKKRFKNLIQSIHDKPMSKQRGAIFKAFAEFQGTEKRRDDVLIVGFKVR